MPAQFFICLGAQKAGTTWFYNVLYAHPDVWMPPVKEIHYFDQVYYPENWHKETFSRLRLIKEICQNLPEYIRGGNLRWHITYGLQLKTDNWYLQLLKDGKKLKAFGDITPEYCLIGKKGFQHIKSVDPKVKVLFFMRDPIERVWSHYRMEAMRAKRFRGENLDVWQFLFDPESIVRTRYEEMLPAMREIFGDNLYINFFENMIASPISILNDIYEFLGLKPYYPNFLDKKINPSPEIMMPAEIKSYLLKEYKSTYDYIRKTFNNIPDTWS